jgi:hypothetical protein
VQGAQVRAHMGLARETCEWIRPPLTMKGEARGRGSTTTVRYGCMWWRKVGKRAASRAFRKRGVGRRRCPECQSWQVRRARRRNQWEWLLRAIRLYPFRCEACKHRFLRLSLYGR